MGCFASLDVKSPLLQMHIIMMTTYRLLLYLNMTEGKEHLYSVFWMWSSMGKKCLFWVECDVLFLSVCLGGMGRGCESSGTGWENPPLPPGGTPSPSTSPTSPSLTTLWGTSVTPSPVSATYVHQLVVKKNHNFEFSHLKKKRSHSSWVVASWTPLAFCLGYVEISKSSTTSLHERKHCLFVVWVGANQLTVSC